MSFPARNSAEFNQDGFAIVSVFKAEEMVALRQELVAYLDRLAGALNFPVEQTYPDASFDERIELIAGTDPSYARLLASAVCTDAHRSLSFDAAAKNERLLAAASELLRAPIGERTVRVRANSSVLAEERHAWHSDVAVADGGSCSTIKIAAWIPLSDSGPLTGGLEVACGKRSEPVGHTKQGARFEIAEAVLDSSRKVEIECPAGSALFLDRYTPHRALRNLSGKTRWSLVVWMKSAPV